MALTVNSMATSTAIAIRIAKRLSTLWPETITGRTVLSAVLHGFALLLLTNWWWLTAHRLHPAGFATGTRIVLHYKPGKLAEQSDDDRRVVQRQHVAPRRTMRTASSALARPSAPSIVADSMALQHEAGDDARGDGSASLRYVQAFPDQRPDFSGLGTTADVVIDVQIDETGRVQRVFARKSMGPAIDGMVIATVQRWMFDPARKDGRAVSSVQELHFHYDRSWSKGNCGWDCIGLMSQ